MEDDTQWWADEYWEIHSIKQKFGLTLVINFLVWGEDIGDAKEKFVFVVTAAKQRATYMVPRADDIAVHYISTRGFSDQEMESFVQKIAEFRESV